MATQQKTKESMVKAEQDIRASGNYIGELVFWSMSEAEPTRDQFKNALLDANIDVNFMPRTLSDQQAFSRATAEIKKLAERKDSPLGVHFVRRVWEDENDIVVAVLKGRHDKVTKETAVNQPNVFTFKKSTGDVEIEHDLFKEEFMGAYEYARDHYTHSDVRAVILDILHECEAVCVRDSGGVYFVPRIIFDVDSTGKQIHRQTDPLISCIQKFVQSPHMGFNTFCRLALAEGDAETSKSVAHAFDTAVMSQLEAVEKELEAMETSSSTRSSTIHSRINEIDSVRQTAKMYQFVLNTEFTAVGQRLTKIEERMKKMLGI